MNVHNSLFGWQRFNGCLTCSYWLIKCYKKPFNIYSSQIELFVGAYGNSWKRNFVDRYQFIVERYNHRVLVPIYPNILNYNAAENNWRGHRNRPPNSIREFHFSKRVIHSHFVISKNLPWIDTVDSTVLKFKTFKCLLFNPVAIGLC